MPRRSKTVASPLVRSIMLGAEAAGMGAAEFTRRTGVTLAEAEDPRGRVGRVKYERVLAVLHDAPPPCAPPSGGPGLGWIETSFPLLAGAWLNAPTLRAALGSFLHYRPLLGESDWVVVSERDGAVQVEYVAEGPQAYAAAQAAGNFGILVSIVRAYDEGPATRFSASFTGPPPPSRRFLDGLLEEQAAYGEDRNLLRFSANLDRPAPHHNPALARVIARTLDAELADLQRDASLALTVERTLRRTLAGGRHALAPERVLERVCDDLATTRWTLRRRLAEEGVTFKDLHAQVKLQEARRLLEETSLSLAEVSEQLGFSSPSSFTRFFRNELGQAPLQYRHGRSGAVRAH